VRCTLEVASGPHHDLDVECETDIDGPWNGWVRLKYEMTDYWTGEPLEIDDKIFLATSRHRSAACGWASPGRFTEFPVLGACAGLTKILEDVGSEMRDFGLRSRRGHRAE
jgi:hypothetical protein